MPLSDEAMHHEVRLRAAAWARRLVELHGDRAEHVVRDTLRRGDLSERERLAARFTREALSDLRRHVGYARPGAAHAPQRRLPLFRRLAALLPFRRRAASGRSTLPPR